MFERSNKISIVESVDWMQKNIGFDENGTFNEYLRNILIIWFY